MGIIWGDYIWRFDEVELGIALREWREAQGLRQKDVGAALGVSGAWVSAIEVAKATPSLACASMTKFIELCNMMDADPRKFFTLERNS